MEGTKEKEKTIRRRTRVEGRGGEEEKRRRRVEKDPRGDRHWRRSNNGLLAMIIEHEAAGTLLKSTESRAGGFTCRINFYLVSSLLRPLLLLLRFFLSVLTATGFPGHLCFSHPIATSSVFLPRGNCNATTPECVTIERTLFVISEARGFSIKCATAATYRRNTVTLNSSIDSRFFLFYFLSWKFLLTLLYLLSEIILFYVIVKIIRPQKYCNKK